MNCARSSRGVVGKELQNCGDFFFCDVALEQPSNDDLHRLVLLLLHQSREATAVVSLNQLDCQHENLQTSEEAVVPPHTIEHLCKDFDVRVLDASFEDRGPVSANLAKATRMLTQQMLLLFFEPDA